MTETILKWPNEEGIWMGKLTIGTWFPMRVQLLKKYKEGEQIVNITMPLIAQYPLSEDQWPYMFEGSHPVTEWRKPTVDELIKAKRFYKEETL